jgi:replicative DNA helicase
VEGGWLPAEPEKRQSGEVAGRKLLKDKLPPNSFEAEQGVIGCCIIDPQHCIPDAQIQLTPEHFYDLRCRMVWDLIVGMTAAEVNTATITQRLRDAGTLEQIGGFGFLFECQDAAPSTAHMPVWLGELVDKFTLRRTIQICRDFIDRAHAVPDSVPMFLDVMERDVLAIRPNQRAETDVKALVKESINKLQERFDNPGRIFGITTGLNDLDYLTDGVHGGEMVVIAGLPSTGKSALAGGIAVNAALQSFPVGIFTAEMAPLQIVMRALCSEARVNSKRIAERDIPRIFSPATKISKAPIFIERASGLTIGQVVAMARRMKQRHGIRIIVVDYIQLLQGVGDNREQAVASISNGLKAMALELDCAVLALSQLNDQGRLRESRAIGQDADSVWKLENDGPWETQVQPITLTVEKCRDGETGKIKLQFLKTITRFECAAKIDDADVPLRQHNS